MKRFSVIIPIYNAESIIERCLDSIACQSCQDYEIVVVNDGSKDNSEEIVRQFIQSHENIRINLINQKNAGAGAARNTGIGISEGEFVVFLDADDYVDRDYLERINEKIEEENADVIFIDIVREKEDGTLIRHESMSRFSTLSKERLIRWQLTGKVPWGGVRKVVRASIIKDNHLEYAPIKVGEESIFSFRELEMAKKIAFQSKAIYHYVETETSLTSHDEVDNSLRVFDYIYTYLKDSGRLKDYADTIRAMAVTTMAIAMNVAYKNQGFKVALSTSKKLLSEYKPFYDGKVDKDALEWRVKMCLPWIKMGWTMPVLIASGIMSIFTKIKKL